MSALGATRRGAALFRPARVMLRRIGFQMSAAATIGCAGDVLQQALEGKASLDDFDVARSARLATYRGLQAPVFDVS